MSTGRLASPLGATAMALLLGCGCAPCRRNLVREGAVRVQTRPSCPVEIFWVSACQHREHVDVTGHARNSRRSGFPSQGHVDVSMFSPDGQLLATARTEDFQVPRHRLRQAPGGRRFRAHLPITPPREATVRVAFHSGSHEAEASAVAQ
jgi:hypothetical protein